MSAPIEAARDALEAWDSLPRKTYSLSTSVSEWLEYRMAPTIARLRTALAAAEQTEPNMRHPKIQALIGGKARREIELRLVEQLLEDPDCDLTSMDMEYWNSTHDKLREALLALAAAEAQPKPLTMMGEHFLGVIAGLWHENPDYSVRQTLDALNAKWPAAQPVSVPVAWSGDPSTQDYASTKPSTPAGWMARSALQQAALALEELQGSGFLIGGVMHYRIGLILPKLNEAIDALAAPPAQPAAPAEPIPTGEATDSDFGAFQDAAR